MTRDEALDKLRKLHGLAKRASTPGEAQAALAQAAGIATRYGIAKEELEVEERFYSVVMGSHRKNIGVHTLFNGITELCGCCGFMHDGNFVLAGRSKDRETAKILILASVDTMEAQLSRQPRGTKKAPFCSAFADVLLERMKEAQNEVMETVRTKALAVIGPKERQLNAEMQASEELGGFEESHIHEKHDPVSRARGAGAAEKTRLPGEHEAIDD